MDKPATNNREGVPEFDSVEQEVFLQLWRTYDRLKAIEEELFGQFELSAQQYNALRLLDVAHPAGMRTMDLGRSLVSRSPDTTRMLDRLGKRGLIERSRSAANRRVVEVTITKQGRALLGEMSQLLLDMNERQLGHLSSRQLAELARLLKLARKPHEDQLDG